MKSLRDTLDMLDKSRDNKDPLTIVVTGCNR
jgi:hypothetical protein